MKRTLKLLVVLFVGFLILGCGEKSGVHKVWELVQDGDNNFLVVVVSADVDSATDTDNTSKKEVDANLGWNGANATQAGKDAALDGVTGMFEKWWKTTKSDSDNKYDIKENATSAPVIESENKKVSVPNKTEKFTTTYSKDRKRNYHHLDMHLKDYGLPIYVKLDGDNCNDEYTLTEYDPTHNGFTLLPKDGAADDGVYFSDQNLDKRGEILLPTSCGEDVQVTLTYFSG